MTHQDKYLPGSQGLTYGIIDPDYARAFTIIRTLAWQYGYACAMHGSFTRDLDLVLVPWTDAASPAHWLVETMSERLGYPIQHGSPMGKPHGRRTWTLLLPAFGDPRWIDLSVMPRLTKTGAPAES